MPATVPHHIKTISAYHQAMGLPSPRHPMVSVISFDEHKKNYTASSASFVFDFYTIALKRNFNGKIKYGQQDYDFDEGIMTFMAPGQVLRIEVDNIAPVNHSGWLLLFHPDFLRNCPLAQPIRNYEFFGYAVHEALFLSENEEAVINAIMHSIQQEYRQNIDAFSQNIIVSHIEVLLSYAERFYSRQFITRKAASHLILERLEKTLHTYFESAALRTEGLPTVQYIAKALSLSPNYLSSMLKTLTGRTTQQHIHDRLIEKAKEKLSATGLSVSEIAYALGFGHPQSFTKLFKIKTGTSPVAFRQSLN